MFALRRFTGPLGAAVLAGAVCLAGCSARSVTQPRDGGTVLSLENAWPNADGTRWTFLETVQPVSGGAVIAFPDSQAVPLVTIDDAIELLSAPPDTVSIRDTSLYVLQFHGDTTTTAGVHAQHLLGTHWTFGRPGLAAAAAVPRARAAGRAGAALDPNADSHFLGGGAFRKTADWIGAYADYDTALAMEFLDANLVVGHTFTAHPPAFPAGHTVLTAKVVAVTTGTVPGELGARILVQVVYLIDYGADAVFFNGGVPVGWARPIDYGRITYAAGVGPIADEERIGGFGSAPAAPGAYLLRLGWWPNGTTVPARATAATGAPARPRGSGRVPA